LPFFHHLDGISLEALEEIMILLKNPILSFCQSPSPFVSHFNDPLFLRRKSETVKGSFLPYKVYD